jgi:hypothetical protein
MKSAVQIGDATVVAVALALLARRIADRGELDRRALR